MVKTLERNRYALCEKHVIVPFCCSYQVYRYLAGCFGLISCRHYLRKIQNLTLTFFCPLISSKGKEFIARCPPFYPGEFEKKLLTQSRARGVFVFDEKINNAYDEHTFA